MTEFLPGELLCVEMAGTHLEDRSRCRIIGLGPLGY